MQITNFLFGIKTFKCKLGGHAKLKAISISKENDKFMQTDDHTNNK